MTDQTECVSNPAIAIAPWDARRDWSPDADGAVRGWRAPFWDEPDRRPARLAEAIEREVVPRLVLAHRQTGQLEPTRVRETARLDRAEIEAFAHLILASHSDVAFDRIDSLLARGLTVECIYIDLLAPAARHLGDLWSDDVVDFVQVTLALGRLQQILRDLSPVLQEGARLSRSGRHILLAAVPGEQHTFGLVMVAEFFLHAGWNVEGGPMTSADEMALMVGRDWFDVVGLSLASDQRLGQLTANIRAIRSASRNRSLAVMVGGPIFIEHPEYVERVGADGMAASGHNAPEHAEALLVRVRAAGAGSGANAARA